MSDPTSRLGSVGVTLSTGNTRSGLNAEGRTPADTIYSIVNDEPPGVSAEPPGVSAAERLLDRAVQPHDGRAFFVFVDLHKHRAGDDRARETVLHPPVGGGDSRRDEIKHLLIAREQSDDHAFRAPQIVRRDAASHLRRVRLSNRSKSSVTASQPDVFDAEIVGETDVRAASCP